MLPEITKVGERIVKLRRIDTKEPDPFTIIFLIGRPGFPATP
ncbi:MAG: hypothetical protein ACREQR_09670 [Candidatus Binataceae bacterium]